MQTITIHQTHPDINYSLPIRNLYKDYGDNPNVELIYNLNE